LCLWQEATLKRGSTFRSAASLNGCFVVLDRCRWVSGGLRGGAPDARQSSETITRASLASNESLPAGIHFNAFRTAKEKLDEVRQLDREAGRQADTPA
jgi:hypothetical protein